MDSHFPIGILASAIDTVTMRAIPQPKTFVIVTLGVAVGCGLLVRWARRGKVPAPNPDKAARRFPQRKKDGVKRRKRKR